MTVDRLVELLAETGALRHSKDARFRLASGESSESYFDLRPLCGHPEGINIVARLLLPLVREFGARSVGGMASGSIPISTAVSQLSRVDGPHGDSNYGVGSFYVTKNGRIRGRVSSPAVIVDDVVTSGGSAIMAADAVRGAGHECAGMLAIMFRGTGRDRRRIEKRMPLRYLLSAHQTVEMICSCSSWRETAYRS